MNVLIIEDELHTAEFLKEVIEEDSDFLVVKIIDSISETVSFLSRQNQNIDLLFFDIQLSDGHSFEIFKHIDISIPVVFCTAYEEYSIKAFKHNGIDYILKPFEKQEVFDCLNQFKKMMGRIQNKAFNYTDLSSSSGNNYQESFLTQQKEKSIVVKTSDIAVFAIENENVYLYTFGKNRCRVYKNLEYIEGVCHPGQFFRINRQMLVNRHNILSIEPYFNRKLILQLKVETEEKPVVSRLKVSVFKSWLEKQTGL